MYPDKCSTCKYKYMQCPAAYEEISFANCLGEDRVVECKKYVKAPERESQETINPNGGM